MEGTKYVWRKSPVEDDCAALFDGATKVCAVLKDGRSWYLRPYIFGNMFIQLDVDSDSIDGAKRAALQYLHEECNRGGTKQHLDIKARLPELK